MQILKLCEPLLQIGLAYKHMRDKMKKEMQKEEVISESYFSCYDCNSEKRIRTFRVKEFRPLEAQQLMNILNKFKDSDLQKLSKENIPLFQQAQKVN